MLWSAQPYAFQIFTAPEFQGVECTLWPSLYHSTALCESLIAGQTNRQSGKASFLHKVLSPVLDFSLDYELLQYQYDPWLFKTITGAINSSRASGYSPNAALQQKSFPPPTGSGNTSTCWMQSDSTDFHRFS